MEFSMFTNNNLNLCYENLAFLIKKINFYYLYILRGFRKLVIAFFPVKNALN